MFSSGGDTKLIRADSIHYGFWKYAEISLRELPAQSVWQFTGFKILQTTAPLSATGNLFVDNLLVYSKPLSVVSSPKLKNVKIYPNPASDVLFVEVKDNQPVQRLELYSVSGPLIRQTSKGSMPVADIIPGTYMIKVLLKEGTFTVPVIVRR